jgi:dTDP-4-amino-4,6-dideoxygalactose transaminase
MGPETATFEEELQRAVGAPHVVTVNSCTSALFLSLLGLGVGAGDDVICPSFTWCSTANAVLYTGARPVFCDVDDETLTMTPEGVLAALTPTTRAVIAVHYGGLTVDVAGLRAALPPRVAVIEDAAHAFGATYADGRPVGSSGNPTCFSFYANKNLSTAEGGAVALFDRQNRGSASEPAPACTAARRLEALHPSAVAPPLERTDGARLQSQLHDLQAALGRVQLARQPEFTATRLDVAKHYARELADVYPPLKLQARCTEPEHARHLFVVRLPIEHIQATRDDVVIALRARQIGAAIHYAPLHTMPLYAGDQPPVSLPVTERVAREILTLPISASMTVEDASYVTAELKTALMAGVA